jgi:hypothetical protein
LAGFIAARWSKRGRPLNYCNYSTAACYIPHRNREWPEPHLIDSLTRDLSSSWSTLFLLDSSEKRRFWRPAYGEPLAFLIMMDIDSPSLQRKLLPRSMLTLVPLIHLALSNRRITIRLYLAQIILRERSHWRLGYFANHFAPHCVPCMHCS